MPEVLKLPKSKKIQRQTELATLADKKAMGKLTLEDIDAKLNIILEMLEELIDVRL